MTVTITKKISEITGLQVESIIPLTGGYQNQVFMSDSKQNQIILRVSSLKTRSKDEILSEINWCLDLNHEGIKVSKPMLFENEYIRTFEFEDDVYHLVLFEKAPGDKLSYTQYLQDFALFEKLGILTGRIHQNSRDFTKKHKIVRQEWHQNQYLRQFKQFVDSSQTDLIEAYEDVIQKIKQLNRNLETFSLIHGDINVGNFHYNKNEITLFDFDECQFSWYVEDIAIQLFYTTYIYGEDIREERLKKGKEFLKYFLKGYLHERTISNEELLLIPTFLKLREIIVYVGILKNWDFKNLSQWQKDYFADSTKRISSKIPLLTQDELFDFI